MKIYPAPEDTITNQGATPDATRDTPPTEGKMSGLPGDLSGREFPGEQAADVYEAEIVAQHVEETDPEKIVAGGAVGTRPGDHQQQGDVVNYFDQNEATPFFPQQR